MWVRGGKYVSNPLLDYMATRNYNHCGKSCFLFSLNCVLIFRGGFFWYLLQQNIYKYTNLRLPIGGVAYGTPKYASTVGLLRTIRPRSSPYFVFTVFELYLRLCTALLAWHDQIGRHIRIVVSNSSVCFDGLKIPTPLELVEQPTPPPPVTTLLIPPPMLPATIAGSTFTIRNRTIASICSKLYVIWPTLVKMLRKKLMVVHGNGNSGSSSSSFVSLPILTLSLSIQRH